MKLNNIAKIVHEANRAYCQTIGDHSQPTWEEAPEWQRLSATLGAGFHIKNPDAGPAHSHEEWLKEKSAMAGNMVPLKTLKQKNTPVLYPTTNYRPSNS